MDNLLGFLKGSALISIGSIAIIIYLCIKKEKYWFISMLFVAFIAIGCFIGNIPYIKDFIEQETTTVVAEFTDFSRPSTKSTKHILYFETEDGELILEAPVGARMPIALKEGKIYEIEYYNNSKVIKEYKRIWNAE